MSQRTKRLWFYGFLAVLFGGLAMRFGEGIAVIVLIVAALAGEALFWPELLLRRDRV